jgi:hypothetical protein
MNDELHRCQGSLIKNEGADSNFSEAFVCVWCGHTQEALPGIRLGQQCKKYFKPPNGNTLAESMNSVRATEAAKGHRGLLAVARSPAAEVGQRPASLSNRSEMKCK